ncbi:SMP-30/gluconolactonase/LRE family protein [Pararobbsia silviterrae]|uniref:SMP-30/gluconolactonase/LRE family protein n=1 Tax=Pararobbsia silviterrae TaxID=1792498 RepID=A0A494XSB0_9BURK|nr:SMP-30/gluconolactonase/LRE family protein [Pararobbsia silviterrae]RKP51746.1 SMP-30/gluconolactonase/LRE family protein [Pararobbsia silviterrae]
MALEPITLTSQRLAERPLWCDRSRRLWWLDVQGPGIHSYDPAQEQFESYRLEGKTVGGLALSAGCDGTTPEFVLAQDDALYLWQPGRPRRLLVRVLDDDARRLNELVCDRAGRLWFGSMSSGTAFTPVGALHSFDGVSLVTHLEGIRVPNALASSPDGTRLYFADTPEQIIWSFDLARDRMTLDNRRIFVDLRGAPGRPDGCTVDWEGYVWSAEFNGARIVRYSPEGQVDRIVALPCPNVTCPGFGGEGLSDLYITTASIGIDEPLRAQWPLAGRLFRIDTATRGLSEPRFMAPGALTTSVASTTSTASIASIASETP